MHHFLSSDTNRWEARLDNKNSVCPSSLSQLQFVHTIKARCVTNLSHSPQGNSDVELFMPFLYLEKNNKQANKKSLRSDAAAFTQE